LTDVLLLGRKENILCVHLHVCVSMCVSVCVSVCVCACVRDIQFHVPLCVPPVVCDSDALKTLPVVSSNGFQLQLVYDYVNR